MNYATWFNHTFCTPSWFLLRHVVARNTLQFVMPGSILINGRGSTSPDRHVTFGNIERYDILTSNEIKDNKVKRQYGGTLITPSGNYPMTRLDIRIRKAIILAFNYLPGDTVAYSEIIEFLLEFGVIVNKKNCNQRQITAIIQASYPKVIIKPSAKHSVIFVNLENRSDDVIKEELIRVTTEPIIDPIEQSNLCVMEWIKSETEKFSEFVYGEDEELKSIEEKSQLKQIEIGEEQNLKSRFSVASLPLTSSSPRHESGSQNPTPGTDRVDKSISDDNTDELIHPPEMEKLPDLISSVNDAMPIDTSIGKSRSVSDLADIQDNGKLSTKLKRTRSFQRSTDRSYVGSIRDRFRTLIDTKAEDVESVDEVKPINPKSINKFNKYETNPTIEQMKRRDKSNTPSSVANGTTSNPKSDRNVWRNPGISRTNDYTSSSTTSSTASLSQKFSTSGTSTSSSQRFSTSGTTTSSSQKFSSSSNLSECREPNPSSMRRTNSFRSSCKLNGEQSDYRYPQRFEGNEKNNKDASKSVSRKSSFRDNRTSILRIHNSNMALNKDQSSRASSSNDLSNSRRLYGYEKDHLSAARSTSSNDLAGSKSSLALSRRFNNSSDLSSNKDLGSSASLTRSNSNRSLTKNRQDARSHTSDRSIERSSFRGKTATGSSGTTKNPTYYKHPCNERPKAGGKKHGLHKISERDHLKRTHRRNSVETNSMTSSLTSSMCSSPDLISDVDLPVLDLAQQTEQFQSKEEKDIIRIAKAFQKAKLQTETINDNIAAFMKRVATEDLEFSNNNRLNLEDLYKHIREKMILAKDEIFEGTRSEFTVEMSQYFDLLFTNLATHLDRVGCEIITNQSTGEKACFLTHVKLAESSSDTIEEESSYV